MVAIPDWSRLISNPSITIANIGIPGDSIEGLAALETQPQALILWIGATISSKPPSNILNQRFQSLFATYNLPILLP